MPINPLIGNSQKGITILNAIVAVGLIGIAIFVLMKALVINTSTTATIEDQFSKRDLQKYILRKIDCQETSRNIIDASSCDGSEVTMFGKDQSPVSLSNYDIKAMCIDKGTHFSLEPLFKKIGTTKWSPLFNEDPQISCTKNPCRQIRRNFEYACIHVIHRGSSALANAINPSTAPQWEQACEVNFKLTEQFTLPEIAGATKMTAEWMAHQSVASGTFPDDYNENWIPATIGSAPTPGAYPIVRAFGPGRTYEINNPGLKGSVIFTEYDAGTQDFKIRTEWNGWGKCRYDDPHCSAYINGIEIQLESGQCDL